MLPSNTRRVDLASEVADFPTIYWFLHLAFYYTTWTSNCSNNLGKCLTGPPPSQDTSDVQFCQHHVLNHVIGLLLTSVLLVKSRCRGLLNRSQSLSMYSRLDYWKLGYLRPVHRGFRGAFTAVWRIFSRQHRLMTTQRFGYRMLLSWCGKGTCLLLRQHLSCKVANLSCDLWLYSVQHQMEHDLDEQDECILTKLVINV